LPAVDDLLLEDAELVADAVSECRNFERRQRIDETGREPAEAAVAESRLRLLRKQLVEIETELRDGLLDALVDAKVDEVIAEVRSIRNSAERYATVREPCFVYAAAVLIQRRSIRSRTA